jgi:hypothetical protein
MQFCMKRLRALKFFQIFQTKNQKSKNSGLCLFQGLSNDTTMRLIQSGQTVPLNSRTYPPPPPFPLPQGNTASSVTILPSSFFSLCKGYKHVCAS